MILFTLAGLLFCGYAVMFIRDCWIYGDLDFMSLTVSVLIFICGIGFIAIGGIQWQ